jgi:hypothetical protein
MDLTATKNSPANALKTCPNCSTDVEHSYNFCPGCGQEAHVHRFNMPHFFHEVFHAFTHADKGVFHLIKNLAVRPGVTAREYILEGKRKKYFNPFTFLILVLGFTVFINSYFQPYGKTGPAAAQTSSASPSRVTNPDRVAVSQRRDAVMSLLNKRANVIAFIAIPIVALVFWLFFRKTGLRYAEHLVALIFFSAFFQFVAALITLALVLTGQSTAFISPLQLGFQLLYLPIAYYQFLNYHKRVQLLRTLLASVLALGVWILLSSQAIRLYIMYGL